MAPTEELVRNERGTALALALFALVVIGGLVANSFFTGLLEQQSGTNVLASTLAVEAAEEGLCGLSELSVDAALGLPIGATMDLGPLALPAPPEALVERELTRLADNLFLLQSRATLQESSAGRLATRSVGLLASVLRDGASGQQILAPIRRRAWLQLY